MEENSIFSQIKEMIDQQLKTIALSQKTILTIDELSDYLGLTPNYIRKLTHNKEIPYYKPMGKKLYFNREEIDDWILSSRVTTAEELRAEARKRIKRF